MKRTLIGSVSIFFCLLFLCNAAFADLYTYVDDKGIKHLTNAPNDLRYKYTLLREKPDPSFSPQSQRSLTTTSNHNEVNLIKNGGVYEVPVILNNVLSIYFILDSGASDVSISPDVALVLIRTKTIKKGDWLPGAYYKFADGTKAKSERFKLKSLKIGNIELTNVTCRIANSLEAPMLLGQSALQKLRRYSIDYDNNVMIFN